MRGVASVYMIEDDTTRSHEDEDNGSYEQDGEWDDNTTIEEEGNTMVQTMARLEVHDREPHRYSAAHTAPVSHVGVEAPYDPGQ